MTPTEIRQQERIVNAELARLLRERCGLDAQAEVIVDGRQPDILIVRSDNTPVIVETELMPARSVNDDALAKLGLPVNGQPTGVTFAVRLPAELRDVEQRHLGERVAIATLNWQEWFADSTSGAIGSGSYEGLAEQVRRAEPKSDPIAGAVLELETGASAAGALIHAKPEVMRRVAQVFDRDATREVANMAALMVINAMVFNDRLSSVSGQVPMLPRPPMDGTNLAIHLNSTWSSILKIDYWPVFRTAYDVLYAIPSGDAHRFALSCLNSAHKILAQPVVGRHDLAGQVFNRLVADRKFLAANYTTIPVATLLAGLALDKERWPKIDWSNAESLRDLVVLDPACGTGTLLMAAYREIAQNHRLAANPQDYDNYEQSLHKTLIEDTIQGADVVDAAIHITASMLASLAPSISFQRMNLHVLPLDEDEIDGARVGSLDWLDSDQLRTMFSGAGEQVGALDGIRSTTLRRPEPNLVLANPPYRRHESATGEGSSNTRVFGHKDIATERALSKRLSKLMEGKPGNQIAGLGSSFITLADFLLSQGGRLAFVLPVTSIAGSSWSEIRTMLAEKYEVEYVVSTHDPRAHPMSFDTAIGEILIVAKKVLHDEDPSGRGVFVNLRRHPRSENEAIALVGAMRRAPKQLHRVDGPPVGGTPLMLGNDQWGELTDFSVRSSRWGGANWMNAACGQFAFSLADGELWDSDGTSKVADIPINELGDIATISPHHRQIRGGSGVFTIREGWDVGAQYPSVWHHSAEIQRSIAARPNAQLSPKPGVEFRDAWKYADRLHVTPEVRYTSQRIHGIHTQNNALGVRSWHTLSLKSAGRANKHGMEAALSLWFNSTLGLLSHSNHSNRSQNGRGLGDRTMLTSLPTLDVHQLADWQIDAAENVFRDFRDVQFEPFYKCDVDANRIRLDERLVRDVLGLSTEAVYAVARIRTLLANEPSIYGNKQPSLR